MKKNQNMIRRIGNFEVIQRTKDGMFNATLLVNQWNAINNDPKRLDVFLKTNNTKEFISALFEDMALRDWNTGMQIADDKQFLNTTKRWELELFDTQNIPNTIMNTTRGKYGGTWMHPYLFMKFSMWLNPRFEVKVIEFVYDQLIKYRHAAGDNYKTLSGAVSKFDNVNYKQVAKGLNHIVFGKHESGLRQKATEKQLEKLFILEEKLAFAVDMDYIKSFDDLIGEMRRIYHSKT